jgi:hypothetical protein
MGKYKIIPNPDLLAAGRAFVPIFGSDADLSIVSRLISLQKDLSTVDNEHMRSGKNLTKKMTDILFKEIGLIREINNRNMDF